MKKVLLGCIVVVILVVGVAVFLQTRPETDTPGEGVETGGQSTKGERDSSATPGTPITPPGQASDSKDTAGTPDTNATLLAPSGTFVGNHKPNLSGSPAPNTIESVCTTTSGATCQITFTKDGVTKTLEARTTDRGGAAYWTWKLQDIGLTEGSWKVQAKATLGSQTKTTDDALALEVRP